MPVSNAHPIARSVGTRPAEAMAARLFHGRDALATLPFWADGGEHSGAFSPNAHYLTAFPDRVDRLRVEDLPFRGLEGWLRARLNRSGTPAPLTVVALAYDAGRNLEHIPQSALESPRLPDVIVARYPAFFKREDGGREWTLHARDQEAADQLMSRLDAGSAEPDLDRGDTLPRTMTSETSRPRWLENLGGVLQGIAAGDFYQANISRRLSAPMPSEATPSLYARMRTVNPAGFGALWAMAPDLWLASSSPECLLQWNPDTMCAHSFPIKGTRPRATGAEDASQLEGLLGSEKDRAEHLMIVDLVRNDLGRIAKPGGVRVDALFAPMTLPTVHHMVSDVVASAKPDTDLASVLTSLFPGGSITGAPKIASMACIETTERLRRGLYTGSLGVVEGTGQATFNILIRSCVAAEGKLYYQTGGGIVADSDPSDEWTETAHKAEALLRALNPTR